MHIQGRSIVFAVLVAAMGGATPARAQTPRVGGPFSGLFGGQPQQATHSLDARGSLFGLYQRISTSAALDEQTDPRFRTDPLFAGVAGGLSYGYNRQSNRGSLTANAAGYLSDYSIAPHQLNGGFNGGAGLSTKLTQQIVFGASANTTYSPYYGIGGFGASGSPIVDQTLLGSSINLAALPVRNLSSSATTSITDNLTRRTTLSATGMYSRISFLDETNADSWTFNGRGVVTQRLARTLSVYVGISESITQFQRSNTRGRSGGLEAGLNYGDAFVIALARRTSLALSAGASSVYYQGGSHYALTGSSVLSHTMRRTWSSSLSYERTLRFNELFEAPVLTDSVFGSIGGLVAPRLRWVSGAGWSRGVIGFDSSQTVITYTGTSSLSLALSRSISAYAQYAYYYYDVSQGTSTLTTFPRFSRQTVAVGLSAFAPLLRRGTGRPRDTR